MNNIAKKAFCFFLRGKYLYNFVISYGCSLNRDHNNRILKAHINTLGLVIVFVNEIDIADLSEV